MWAAQRDPALKVIAAEVTAPHPPLCRPEYAPGGSLRIPSEIREFSFLLLV